MILWATTRFEFWIHSEYPVAMKSVLCLTLTILFLAGCATTPPNSEFVRSIDFTPLDTFEYRHTLISGMEFHQAQQQILQHWSRAVAVEVLQAKGFGELQDAADFFVVTKWKKGLSLAPGRFDVVDGVDDVFRRARERDFMQGVRLQLTVEIYEGASGQLFWHADYPNIFDAVDFTEARVQAALRQALERFPTRVEKDPNLQDFQ